MIIVRITDVEIQARHAVLPEHCPKCGAASASGVTEVTLSEALLDGQVTSDDPSSEPERLGSFDFAPGARHRLGDGFVVTGYRCLRCRANLTAGEFVELD